MRIKVVIVVCTLFCFLVDPVLAASLRVAKVYRDYPGYINPAVCENPNVSKPPAAPAPQTIVVPLPVVPETAAGTLAQPATPAPTPAPVAAPTPAALPVAASAIEPALPSSPASPVLVPAPVAAPAVTATTTAPVAAPAVTPAAPAPVAVPAVTAAAPGPAAAPAVKVTAPAPAAVPAVKAIAPAAATPPVAASTIKPPTPAASPIPGPTPANKPDLSVPRTANIEPLNPASANIKASNPVAAPYLTLWAGMAAHHDTEIDVDNSRITFDTGLAGGAAAGYDFGPARLEIEGSYRHNNADEGDADLDVTTLMANVYADFETDGPATPYLGVGVGVANVDLEDEDDQVLAGQVAAGMLFAVTEKVAIDLGYRYMVADAPDIVGNDKELQQHTALIGVQIKF